MRILILVAIASQTAAFIFSIFGLNCTSIGLQRPDLKYRLVRRKSDKDTFLNVAFRTLFPLFFIWFRLYLFQLAPSCSRSHWWKILINPTNIRYFKLQDFGQWSKGLHWCWWRMLKTIYVGNRCNWPILHISKIANIAVDLAGWFQAPFSSEKNFQTSPIFSMAISDWFIHL